MVTPINIFIIPLQTQLKVPLMRCLIVNAHESHVIKKKKLDLNETIFGVLCIPGLFIFGRRSDR